MSETKHTPAPWYWCDGEEEKDLPYLTSNAGKICEFGNWEAYYPQCGELPNEADRRLIAAAPELLEALEWLVTIQSIVSIPEAMHSRTYQIAVEQARAAIAKAKGEQL